MARDNRTVSSSAVATTLDAAITLTGDSTIRVSNSGAAVSHIISGEIFALPGADLSFTGVGGATPSTLILAPAATTGARWGDTSVGAGAIVQVGTLAGARGFLGVGSLSIASGGTLAISTNDNYVIDNAISGAGTLAINRNANYLTGDLSAFSGTLFVTPASGQNVNVSAELGNDTYGSSFGTGAVTVTASAIAGGGSRDGCEGVGGEIRLIDDRPATEHAVHIGVASRSDTCGANIKYGSGGAGDSASSEDARAG